MSLDPLVCIVDDDAAVRDSLSLMLGLKGYDCRTYDSGESFLAAPPNRPACLILDLKMGGMDGLSLQQALKGLPYRHQIIFLTAFADTEVMRSAFIERAVDFLEKPVVRDRLCTFAGKPSPQPVATTSGQTHPARTRRVPGHRARAQSP